MTDKYHKLCNTCPFGTIKLDSLQRNLNQSQAVHNEVMDYVEDVFPEIRKYAEAKAFLFANKQHATPEKE